MKLLYNKKNGNYLYYILFIELTTLSLYLVIYISIYQLSTFYLSSIYLSYYYLFFYLFLYLSAYMSNYSDVCLSVYQLSIYQFISISYRAFIYVYSINLQSIFYIFSIYLVLCMSNIYTIMYLRYSSQHTSLSMVSDYTSLGGKSSILQTGGNPGSGAGRCQELAGSEHTCKTRLHRKVQAFIVVALSLIALSVLGKHQLIDRQNDRCRCQKGGKFTVQIYRLLVDGYNYNVDIYRVLGSNPGRRKFDLTP